ncbi:MAG: hypothetical protein ACQETD_03185 [Pseudomonadota bacterium]
MEREKVPQEGNATLGGERKALYAVDREGHYTLVPSAGSQVEEAVTAQALAEFERLREQARRQVEAGRASPLAYHMYDKRMDPLTLAQSVGLFAWRVRRHLKPGPFRRLPQRLLARYAEALGMAPAALQTLPERDGKDD